MSTQYKTATASRSAQTAQTAESVPGKSIEDYSIEEIDAFMKAREAKVAAKQEPIEQELNTQYAKCVELANQIKEFNPGYKTPWETATPLMLGHAIKDWLKEHGGSATTQGIMEQFAQLNTEKQIGEVLKGRTKGGKYRLWDYNESKDTYTLKTDSKTNSNN